MATQEFYIRNASETEARGPFTIEQLVSLAKAGQVTADTLYYDANAERWLALGSDLTIKAAIFPEKKKLVIKKAVRVNTLNKTTETQAPIEVTDMLAAAEGRTADTRDRGHNYAMAERCAKAGLYGCMVMLILAAATEILPSIEIIVDFSPDKLLTAPIVALGLLDMALVVLMFLGVVATYPFLRFRAMFGLGFLGLFYWLQRDHLSLAASVAGSLGLYCSTIFLSYLPTTLALIFGLAGFGSLVYLHIFL